jgi:hypothetical protein
MAIGFGSLLTGVVISLLIWHWLPVSAGFIIMVVCAALDTDDRIKRKED